MQRTEILDSFLALMSLDDLYPAAPHVSGERLARYNATTYSWDGARNKYCTTWDLFSVASRPFAYQHAVPQPPCFNVGRGSVAAFSSRIRLSATPARRCIGDAPVAGGAESGTFTRTFTAARQPRSGAAAAARRAAAAAAQ